jgi:uncharacterized protein (TIGR03437 family)
MSCFRRAFLILSLTCSLSFAQSAARDFFDDSVIHEIRLNLDSQDWDSLQATYLQNTYYKADVSSGNLSAPGVGIRLRGRGSRSPDKPNLDVNVDKYVKHQTFAGLAFFVLKANTQDASLVREALAFKLFRRCGLPAPREAPVRLFINGEYFGFYTLVEHEDEDFLGRNFGESGGDMYEWKPNQVYHFEYLGPDPALYSPILLDPKSEGTPDVQTFIDMVQAINSSPDAEFVNAVSPYLDLKLYLAHAAIESALGELDGIWGDTYGMNNFYLYRFQGQKRFQFITWDKDLTFRYADRPILGGAMDNRLGRRLMAIPEYRNTYLADLDKAVDLLGGPGGWAEQELNRMSALISLAAYDDPHKQCIFDNGMIGSCSTRQFDVEMGQVRSFIATRAPFVKAELAKQSHQMPTTDPAINSVSLPNRQSGDAVVPGSIVRVTGARFGKIVADPNMPLERISGNTFISMDGVRAPIVAATAGSVDVQTPWDLAWGQVPVVVVVDGALSISRQVPVMDAAPQILAVVHSDGSLVSKDRPARPGEVLVISANGLGAVDDDVETGDAAPMDDLINISGKVSVSIGATPLGLVFCGLSPGSVALYQVNVSIPAGLQASSQANLELAVGDQRTTTTIDMAG